MNDVQHVVGFGGLERDDGVQRWDETIAGEGARRREGGREGRQRVRIQKQEHSFCSVIDCIDRDWLPGVM